MMARLKGKPADVVIVQVYVPAIEYKDEEVDAVYDRIEKLKDKETDGKDYTSIMQD